MLSIPCILFAGGKSSRMGTDKALLPFGDFDTLTQYQLNKLQKIFHTVYISCKDKKKFTFNANFIQDLDQYTFAPTSGFLSSFELLQSQQIFVISVDTPFINEETINKLVQVHKPSTDATVAMLDSKAQPMCGVYNISLLDKFKSMQKNNQHKLIDLLSNASTAYLTVHDKQEFLNLNKPQDYKEALRLI